MGQIKSSKGLQFEEPCTRGKREKKILFEKSKSKEWFTHKETYKRPYPAGGEVTLLSRRFRAADVK